MKEIACKLIVICHDAGILSKGHDLQFRRPGILVLINDADWELEGELEYQLQDRDEVVFISTLHGG